MAWNTVATILGNPDFAGEEHRAYSAAQLRTLRDLGFNTVFVNLAWSRPWLDAVTLEEVVTGTSYPWLSEPHHIERNVPRLRQRIAAIVEVGLRPFFLWGCPKQIDLRTVPAQHHAAALELTGAPHSRIDPRLAVACIQHPAVREHYRELLREHFALFGATAGILFYTVDELAEVCDEQDACPRCRGIPLHERLPDFLRFLRGVIDEHKPDAEMWWEPWEFTATQTYAVVERLDPRIGLALHSSIHEVYYVNRPDGWFRHICRLAAERGIPVVAELFMGGTGEDLGPVPAFPCPRLVYEQLRSVRDIPAVGGIKEYYGTVAEHAGPNDWMLQAFLGAPDAPFATLVEGVAGRYGSAQPMLLRAWEHAARALEVYPWSLSWRLRHYNMERYDRPRPGSPWGERFAHTLLTPWTTPSWESSRRAAYIVSSSVEPVGARMLMETEAQFERVIASLERALDDLDAAHAVAEPAHHADIARQELSVRIFRHLTLARLLHLRADRAADALRHAAGAADVATLRGTLQQDIDNARALLAVTDGRTDHNIDRTALEATLNAMHQELATFDAGPIPWVGEHFV
jgi:hypothetical protein